MTAGIYIVAAMLAILWLYIIITRIRLHNSFKKKYNLKGLLSTAYVQRQAEDLRKPNILDEYYLLEKKSNKLIWAWVLGCVLAVRFLFTLGIATR